MVYSLKTTLQNCAMFAFVCLCVLCLTKECERKSEWQLQQTLLWTMNMPIYTETIINLFLHRCRCYACAVVYSFVLLFLRLDVLCILKYDTVVLREYFCTDMKYHALEMSNDVQRINWSAVLNLFPTRKYSIFFSFLFSGVYESLKVESR